MARIKNLTREEAPEEARDAFDANERAFGQVLNTTAIVARRPSIMKGAGALGRGIAESGLLSEKLRDLVNVRISSQVGCVF